MSGSFASEGGPQLEERKRVQRCYLGSGGQLFLVSRHCMPAPITMTGSGDDFGQHRASEMVGKKGPALQGPLKTGDGD